MAYEHEKSLKNRLLDLEFDTWEEVHQFKREYDELEEVFIKAKAFDKISDVIKKAEFYDRDTALDIIEIVEDLEDKQND
ncbi:hypothetical protein RM614_03445 [Mammaliicoccus sciuri]|uniref:hypothetical protein n=1 Tax=Mammaliicoccus sciuri TaxID=1296 RepID=UPI0028855D01|nr:hypothetical protein [Mammaliicoccus sciuri]MDT0710180.1 hypothetical protein [Mammaliicoccus sciuri]